MEFCSLLESSRFAIRCELVFDIFRNKLLSKSIGFFPGDATTLKMLDSFNTAKILLFKKKPRYFLTSRREDRASQSSKSRIFCDFAL